MDEGVFYGVLDGGDAAIFALVFTGASGTLLVNVLNFSGDRKVRATIDFTRWSYQWPNRVLPTSPAPRILELEPWSHELLVF